MNSKTARVAFWVVAVLLFLGAGWSFNIATFNWFAADFHNEYSHAFATRGNIFFIVALVLLAASVAVVVVLRRSGKKQRMAKT